MAWKWYHYAGAAALGLGALYVTGVAAGLWAWGKVIDTIDTLPASESQAPRSLRSARKIPYGGSVAEYEIGVV